MAQKLFSELIRWSNNQYSHLPWRENRTLYKTLVSEIMLQQTTVGTVLNHFEKFLATYPTIHDLAKSTEEQVCISWKGLGYYRRARSLHNIAIQIIEKYNGKIPTDLESLLTLKGIGPYTANAIVAIGADKKALAVDANLERVLSRFYGVRELKGPKLQKELWTQFNNKKILPEIEKLSARAINEALMDLGRIVCQSRKASCTLCPLANACHAKLSGAPLDFPVEVKKIKANDYYIKLLRIVVRSGKKIIVYKKLENEWLSGQWEIPTFILETNDKDLVQYPKIKMLKSHSALQMIKTGITKYKIENFILEMTEEKFNKFSSNIGKKYVYQKNEKNLNVSTSTIKILKLLEQ
jgi:A/G-specific adenine glycosylase